MIDSLKQMYHFLAPGGPVMGLIALGSVICVALIVERAVSLRRKRVFPPRVMRELESLLKEKKISEALALARGSEAPVARVVVAGLEEREEGEDRVREAMENAGRRESTFLERNLEFLGTLAAAAPLMGLLGTVTGMIRTFGVIRIVGVGDPLKLSGGIAEALLNTAAGLVVGIPALISQRFFLNKVDRFVAEMEEFAEGVIKAIRRA